MRYTRKRSHPFHSVGELRVIALGYGLNDRGFESRLRVWYCSPNHHVQTGSGAHPAS